jgi:plasmid stabilization system protein ParE
MAIIWDEDASDYLESAIEFIRKDSYQNAETVKNKVLDSITDLIKNPEMYPLDKYNRNKKRLYRAFEVYKFRISYLVSQTEISVVRIRHASQKPLDY